MENINDMIEDCIEDSEEVTKVEELVIDDSDDYSDNLDDDNEESESNGKTPRVFVPKRQAILNFGDKCRARFLENDANIFFEKRSQNKLESVGTDSDEGYSNDGYFRDLENVIKYVFSINFREKLLHKKEVRDLEEIKDILKLCNADMKVLANEVVRAIKNNEIFAEITEELMDRG